MRKLILKCKIRFLKIPEKSFSKKQYFLPKSLKYFTIENRIRLYFIVFKNDFWIQISCLFRLNSHFQVQSLLDNYSQERSIFQSEFCVEIKISYQYNIHFSKRIIFFNYLRYFFGRAFDCLILATTPFRKFKIFIFFNSGASSL